MKRGKKRDKINLKINNTLNLLCTEYQRQPMFRKVKD